MQNWKRKAVTILTPRENKDTNSIKYWREKIFYTIILGAAILGFLTLVPSIISCYYDGLYVQIAIDLIVFSVILFFVFNTRVSYKIKSNLFLILVYILGVSLTLMGGSYIIGGFIYLVAFSVAASVWRGTKIAIFTIALNTVTVFTIGYLCYNQIIYIESFNLYKLSKWFSLGANLFIVNCISAISVSLLIDGLERTINQSIKLKNQLNEEKLKLLVAKQKAEEADQLKTIFLGNMSHELKTPLNGIIGFSNLILESKMEDINEIYSFQKIISESGEMLLGLINDILDITVIESGQLKITKTHVLLMEIINEIAYTFDEKIIGAQHKNIKFEIIDNLNQDDFNLYTDALRLKQVIINLVKNALKFTNQGGINFSYELTEDKKYLLFKVEDTGIGIHPENQKEIFKRFSQLGDSANNKFKGTGLGLTISKEIVELLGGKIWVESKYTKGSTFYFTVQIEETESKAKVDE
jgi:signal transduction histidine kinase